MKKFILFLFFFLFFLNQRNLVSTKNVEAERNADIDIPTYRMSKNMIEKYVVFNNGSIEMITFDNRNINSKSRTNMSVKSFNLKRHGGLELDKSASVKGKESPDSIDVAPTQDSESSENADVEMMINEIKKSHDNGSIKIFSEQNSPWASFNLSNYKCTNEEVKNEDFSKMKKVCSSTNSDNIKNFTYVKYVADKDTIQSVYKMIKHFPETISAEELKILKDKERNLKKSETDDIRANGLEDEDMSSDEDSDYPNESIIKDMVSDIQISEDKSQNEMEHPQFRKNDKKAVEKENQDFIFSVDASDNITFHVINNSLDVKSKGVSSMIKKKVSHKKQKKQKKQKSKKEPNVDTLRKDMKKKGEDENSQIKSETKEEKDLSDSIIPATEVKDEVELSKETDEQSDENKIIDAFNEFSQDPNTSVASSENEQEDEQILDQVDTKIEDEDAYPEIDEIKDNDIPKTEETYDNKISENSEEDKLSETANYDEQSKLNEHTSDKKPDMHIHETPLKHDTILEDLINVKDDIETIPENSKNNEETDSDENIPITSLNFLDLLDHMMSSIQVQESKRSKKVSDTTDNAQSEIDGNVADADMSEIDDDENSDQEISKDSEEDDIELAKMIDTLLKSTNHNKLMTEQIRVLKELTDQIKKNNKIKDDSEVDEETGEDTEEKVKEYNDYEEKTIKEIHNDKKNLYKMINEDLNSLLKPVQEEYLKVAESLKQSLLKQYDSMLSEINAE